MMTRTLRTPQALIEAGLAPAERRRELELLARRFAIAVPPAMAALIDPADPDDPIARQFIPTAAELVTLPHELHDPIGDGAHTPVPGIVHRYPDRVLLKLVQVCAVYCRFCFRRELIGPGSEALSDGELTAAIDHVAARPAIREVILTGGDPLVLSERRIADVVGRLAALPHVEIIRIHTRVPVVAPERITEALVAALRCGKPVYVLLHCNHPRELTDAAVAACGRLVDAGIPMLSQSVLLKGVNDDIETLATLMRRFVAARVKPHYLHHGDLTRGTAHLRTSVADGIALMRQLRRDISGLCQPTYILEIPGGRGKVPIAPTHFRQGPHGPVIIDADGVEHPYPDEDAPAPPSAIMPSTIRDDAP